MCCPPPTARKTRCKTGVTLRVTPPMTGRWTAHVSSREVAMGFGASLAFIAIGAVMAFAVKFDVPGIDLHMIGWILIGVGAAGALLTGLYTRRPHAEDTVETIEPDLMYTVDPAAE